ncbi:MAG: CRISPR-associated protein Cas4 [Bacteroidota bacterium]
MNPATDNDDGLLMLSGIQHFSFCERQWALIHIEQQWNDNRLTVEGHFMHEKVDDPLENDLRGDTVTLRSVSLTSFTLGLYGRADVIELMKVYDGNTINSIVIKERPGRWKVIPVEYKRGKPKPDERDEVQLCAQAICLEEMHGICIGKGFLYYGETRHRHEVEFTDNLRRLVKNYAKRMHEIFDKGLSPPPVYKPHCKSCSLLDICLPKTLEGLKSVEEYLGKIVRQTFDEPSN